MILDTDYRNIISEIKQACTNLMNAERKASNAGDVRASLEPGSSRARVTTANARWAQYAEYRDLCENKLRDLMRAYLKGGEG
ncbi:MAG: hypothetical protein WC455_13840 [Dehalococcoidia bacterium]|jgi:hypothetical protein